MKFAFWAMNTYYTREQLLGKKNKFGGVVG